MAYMVCIIIVIMILREILYYQKVKKQDYKIKELNEEVYSLVNKGGLL